MDFLKGIKNSITDYAETKKMEKELDKISDLSDKVWEIGAGMSDNPDLKIDYDNMSKKEFNRKLDYYADRVKKYMEGQIDPHKDNKRFNDDFTLFQHLASKSDKYELLLLDSLDFFEKTNEEFSDISKAKEEFYISEARDIIEGKTDPFKKIDRIRYLLDKYNKHEWFNLELHDKLFDIESEFRKNELFERFKTIKAKQKQFVSTSNNDNSNPANETITKTRSTEEEALIKRAENYLSNNISPFDNWADYSNLLDLFDRYISNTELEDDQLLIKYEQLVNLGNNG